MSVTALAALTPSPYHRCSMDAPTAGPQDAAPATDEDLYGRFHEARDERGLEALIERHWARVFRITFRILRDPALAEDAAQQTFVALARSRGWRGDGMLAAWIARIAVNEARMAARAKRRRETCERAAGRPGGRGGEGGRDSDLAVVIDAELARLPDDLRVPLVLHYAEGFTHEEVGAALGIPSGTASSRLRRGLERLRESLSVAGYAAALPSLEALLAQPPALPTAPKPPSAAAVAKLAARATARFTAILAACGVGVMAVAVTIGLLAAGPRTSVFDRTATRPPQVAVQPHAIPPEPMAPAATASPASERRPPEGKQSATSAGTIGMAAPRSLPSSAAPAPPSEETGSAVIEGRVVERGTGLPIAGARVRLVPAGTTVSSWSAGEDLPDHPVLRSAGPQATGDGAGGFRFAGLGGGKRGLLALHERHLPAFVPLELHDGPNDVIVEMEPTGELCVRVLDPTGEPLPQARVLWSAKRTAVASDFVDGQLGAVREGTYAGLVAAALVEVRAKAEGFAPAAREVAVGANARVEVDLRLGHGAAIEILVTDPEGRPLAGATAGVYGRDAPVLPPAGPDGIVRAERLAPGTLDIWASARGYRMVRRDVPVKEGETPRVAVALERPMGVSGIVRSRTGGTPIGGIEVAAIDVNTYQEMARTSTDAQGRFRFDELPVEAGLAVAPDAGGAEVDLFWRTVRVRELLSEKSDEVTLWYPAPAKIMLRLVMPAGIPEPTTALIDIAGEAGARSADHKLEGRVAAISVHQPGRYDLAIRVQGCAMALLPAIEVPFDADPPIREIELEGPGRLEARVVRPDGTPIAGAIARQVLPVAAERFQALSKRRPFPNDVPETVTDETGAFGLSDLGAEPEVEVTAPGYTARRLKPTIRPGETTTAGEIVLEPNNQQ